MQTRLLASRVLALLLVLVPVSARAASYIVPTDDELIDASHAIVIATVRDLHPHFAANRDIVTNVRIDIEEVLKGADDVELPLTLHELGGVIGEEFMATSAGPTFWEDNRALLFLERAPDGSWRTYGASLGKFDFVKDAKGNEYAVRWAHERHVAAWTADGQPNEEPVRDAPGFINHIRARQHRAPGGPRQANESVADYVVNGVKLPQATLAVFPPSAYMTGSFRWNRFDMGGNASFFVSGTQPPYDSTGAAQRALAAWTSDPGSNVDYRYAGTNSAGFVQDSVNTIVFNNSTDVPAGAIAYAKWYGAGTYMYKGETFFATTEGDVVVKAGISVSQTTFDEAVTHELGHTLGFRHSDQGTPASNEAVMKSVLSGAYGASLGPWDIEAVRTVYEGAGTPPTFTFTDDPLQPGTPIKAIHFTELRNAINTFRQYAGLSPYPWAETIAPGVVVKASHIVEMRNALAPALTNVGRSATFAEPISTGTIIKASHIQELRDKMR